MRSIFTDDAPIPEITPDGMVVLHIEASTHPRILVPREVVRRFCSDTLFLIDEYERRTAKPKASNVCRFKKPPPGH